MKVQLASPRVAAAIRVNGIPVLTVTSSKTAGHLLCHSHTGSIKLHSHGRPPAPPVLAHIAYVPAPFHQGSILTETYCSAKRLQQHRCRNSAAAEAAAGQTCKTTTTRRRITARRDGTTIKMRVHSCLERPRAMPEAEAAPFQVPDSRGLTGERGQAVRPRTKTTSRRCSTARRAGKTIEMRVQSCLERPEAIPEAEAAPHEVPRLHAETARASTPEDIISASGIAPGR